MPPVRFSTLLLFFAVWALATEAEAAPCFEAISEATSRKIFAALTKVKPEDGCKLETVATEKSQMKIGWKKGDVLQEPLLVLPLSCASEKPPNAKGKLTAAVPSSTKSACPA